MIRHTLAALALVSVVGCSANSSFSPFSSNNAEQAQLAAYAASNKYPSDVKASSDLRIGTIANPGDAKVKLVNFPDQPVTDARVWVNGIYVHHVDVIPAHGSVSIQSAEFFDSSGSNMSKVGAFPSRLEIESNVHLYSAMSASMQ